MGAQTKDELIAVCRKEFVKLQGLIKQIPDAVALEKDRDGASIKDVIGQRTHWVELFLGWYKAGLAGEDVHFLAEGYTWNDLDRYNADLRAQQASMGWHDAQLALHKAYSDLITFLENATDADLYGGPMAGAKNDWTAGHWAEAAGPSHFRSARKYIRARLRER